MFLAVALVAGMSGSKTVARYSRSSGSSRLPQPLKTQAKHCTRNAKKRGSMQLENWGYPIMRQKSMIGLPTARDERFIGEK